MTDDFPVRALAELAWNHWTAPTWYVVGDEVDQIKQMKECFIGGYEAAMKDVGNDTSAAR
jgi:hypothetical protein